MLELLKYLVYVQKIDELIKAVKAAKTGQPEQVEADMSINGVAGECYIGWKPKTAAGQTDF